eukprot:2101841-Rhodomonas_salina.2
MRPRMAAAQSMTTWNSKKKSRSGAASCERGHPTPLSQLSSEREKSEQDSETETDSKTARERESCLLYTSPSPRDRG